MIKTIVLSGGCFWCTEAVFKMLKGIVSVTSGYSGGKTNNPTYESVSSGNTGHAEAVEIVYEPSVRPLSDLLTVFFATHDPTTRNRQGADVGTQYRSAIFYSDDSQKKEIESFIKNMNASSYGGKEITTEIVLLNKFYKAEDYHQNYYAQNSKDGYCEVVINPKLQKVQEKFADLLKENNS